MPQQWEMPRRNERCTACERPFEVGDVILAVLREAGAGYQRLDYDPDCAPEADDQEVARWRTQRPTPATPKRKPFNRETLLATFRQLDPDEETPRRQRFRFVLALLLWRKKALTLVDSTPATDNAPECWNFKLTGGDETYAVVRPELSETELDELSSQLEDLLADPAGDAEAPAADDGPAGDAEPAEATP